MQDQIINKVEKSGLIQINLEDWLDNRTISIYDISQNLFQGLVLREKDFREFIKEHDWSTYQNQHVGIVTTKDAIIPTWAYMLLISAIQPYAYSVIVGDQQEVIKTQLIKKINELDMHRYKDAKIVIKGCSDQDIPNSVYAELTRIFLPHAKSIMFGEPCSTVPVYKRKLKK